MSSSSLRLSVLLLLLLPSLAYGESAQEIDRQIWSVISRTVAEHDIEGMAALYHDDAVLVHAGGAFPIGPQLARWGADMDRMRESGTSATVAFRFESRQDGEDVAFETGMFRYAITDRAGSETASYARLEALLVKRDGHWLILMERQLATAGEVAWQALD